MNMEEFLYNAQLIDLNDYVQSGEGANGKSYDHKTDSTIMAKIYNDTMDTSLVYRELDFARKVYDAGIPSPEPGDFVTDGQGHYGIRFRRLVGKVSYARAVANEPEKAEYYGIEFGKMCKLLHSTHVGSCGFDSAKDQFLGMLAENPFWNEEEKATIKKIICDTPDTDTAVHGDLHFGNLLLVDGKSYFIDLGEFAMGHPYFDLGMTVTCGAFNDEAFTRESFHMGVADAKRFYDGFIKEYFDGKYTTDEATEMLVPYVIVKSLLIERNSHFRFDTAHDLYDKYIRK